MDPAKRPATPARPRDEAPFDPGAWVAQELERVSAEIRALRDRTDETLARVKVNQLESTLLLPIAEAGALTRESARASSERITAVLVRARAGDVAEAQRLAEGLRSLFVVAPPERPKPARRQALPPTPKPVGALAQLEAALRRLAPALGHQLGAILRELRNAMKRATTPEATAQVEAQVEAALDAARALQAPEAAADPSHPAWRTMAGVQVSLGLPPSDPGAAGLQPRRTAKAPPKPPTYRGDPRLTELKAAAKGLSSMDHILVLAAVERASETVVTDNPMEKMAFTADLQFAEQAAQHLRDGGANGREAREVLRQVFKPR